MTKRKPKTGEEEWFFTEEGRAKEASRVVLELRKGAAEMAMAGENASKVYAWTQAQYDTDRHVQTMLVHYMLEWFHAAREKREELEARVAELEKAPTTYRGVYEEGKTYEAKSIVSHGGSMWHTATKTKARPGEGAPWQLCVKAGRSAK